MAGDVLPPATRRLLLVAGATVAATLAFSAAAHPFFVKSAHSLSALAITLAKWKTTLAADILDLCLDNLIH